MGTNTVQKDDGGIAFVDDASASVMLKVGGAGNRNMKIAKVALAAVDTGGGVLSWANPENVAITIARLDLDITTSSSGACTVDAGTTTSSATTSSDNLIDGVSVAATGVKNNGDDAGTNGKKAQRLAVGGWVTASKASGASSGLVGFAYIHYYLT